MISFPNAKINLGLNVTGRRTDGYHNLETLFYPVSLCDILEITRGEPFCFSVTGIPISGDPENNLVVKAYRLFQHQFDAPCVKIHLHKVIPHGSGLGGGSSDAAVTLKMANALFKTGLSEWQLEEMAHLLGADCPFFIGNTPALATGTGDQIEPVDFRLHDYTIVLVNPPFPVNTALAYRAITPRKLDIPVREIIHIPVGAWRGLLTNDFETPVFKMFPEIRRIKDQLYNLGAVYASMSGSGSTVYGIFKEVPDDIGKRFPDDYLVSY